MKQTGREKAEIYRPATLTLKGSRQLRDNPHTAAQEPNLRLRTTVRESHVLGLTN